MKSKLLVTMCAAIGIALSGTAIAQNASVGSIKIDIG